MYSSIYFSVVVALLFSLSHVTAKNISDYVDVENIIIIRGSIIGLIFLPFLLFFILKKKIPTYSKNINYKLILTSLFFVGATSLLLYSIKFCKVSEAVATIFPLSFIFTAIIAYFLLNECLSFLQVVGIIFAVTGINLINKYKIK